jgi:hypothetical protein
MDLIYIMATLRWIEQRLTRPMTREQALELRARLRWNKRQFKRIINDKNQHDENTYHLN